MARVCVEKVLEDTIVTRAIEAPQAMFLIAHNAASALTIGLMF